MSGVYMSSRIWQSKQLVKPQFSNNVLLSAQIVCTRIAMDCIAEANHQSQSVTQSVYSMCKLRGDVNVHEKSSSKQQQRSLHSYLSAEATVLL